MDFLTSMVFFSVAVDVVVIVSGFVIVAVLVVVDAPFFLSVTVT